jgi:hypothetical protein
MLMFCSEVTVLFCLRNETLLPTLPLIHEHFYFPSLSQLFSCVRLQWSGMCLVKLVGFGLIIWLEVRNVQNLH